MGWKAVSWGSSFALSALGSPQAFFLGIGRLAAVLTSTGTSLTPRECARDSHSITLAFDFARRRFAAFTVSEFRGMEK
jgi:hypothetical protein